jgi:KaiC/GvpD/RAD55 family RecA-like ATPase
LIGDLISEPLPAGSVVLVEYDPTAQWYAASLIIAAGWLQSGGKIAYTAGTTPPDAVRVHLRRLRVNVEELERNDRLRIWDWYSRVMGRSSTEKYSVDSLKAADLSIRMLKDMKRVPPVPEVLRISENFSLLDRYNEEKSWVDFALSRLIPWASLSQSTWIFGVISEIHSNWAYRNLESAVDCVVDFQLVEEKGEAATRIRVRSARNLPFNAHWHRLKISENLGITIER